MAQWYEASLFSPEEVGVQFPIRAGLLFFPFIVLLPFCLLPVIFFANDPLELREIFAITYF